MISKRADVERLLGQPQGITRYEFKTERAYIHYAAGLCDQDNNDCRCLVSEDTVLRIYVELETELKFSKLKVDKTKYKKSVYPEDPNLAIYSNYEGGVIYTVSQGSDDVAAIEYLPTAKDCEEVIRATAGKKQTLAHYSLYTRWDIIVPASIRLLDS